MRASERRKYPRYGFQSDAELVEGQEARRAFITDISMAGMFVVTDAPLLVGASCTVRLLLSPPLVLDCVVRRVWPGKGMGLEFAKPSEAARARLEKLITSLVEQ